MAEAIDDIAKGCSGKRLVALVFFIGLWICHGTFAALAQNHDSREFVVAASKRSWDIDIDSVKCLALLQKRTFSQAFIFGKDYSDDPTIASFVRTMFPEKDIRWGYEDCMTIFGFNIIVHNDPAIRYKGEITRIVMQFDICERDKVNIGHINANLCSTKSMYLFTANLRPFEAFEVGLRAFAHPQEERWEILKLRPQSAMP